MQTQSSPMPDALRRLCLLTLPLAAFLLLPGCPKPDVPAEDGEHVQKAYRAYGFGEKEEAQKEAQAALAVNPESSGAQIILGHLAGDQGNWADASARYQKALEVNRKTPHSLTKDERGDLIVSLARALSESSQFDAAEQTLLFGLTDSPSRESGFRYQLALVYLRTKRDDLVLSQLEQAFIAAQKDGTLDQKVLSAGPDFREISLKTELDALLRTWVGRVKSVPGAAGDR